MLLDGPNVKFTSLDQMFSKRSGENIRASFSVGFEVEDGAVLTVAYGRGTSSGVEVRSTILALSTGNSVSVKIGKKLTNAESKLLIEAMPDGGPGKELIKSDRIPYSWDVTSSRCFPDVELVGEFKLGDKESRFLPVANFPLQDYIKRTIADLIHIQGLRGNPERTYSANARVIKRFQGLFTDYVASVLQQWQDDRSDKLEYLGSDLRELGLSWKVRTSRVHDTQVEIKVGRLLASAQGGAHDLVNLADVGIGVSQVLPFLVALRAAKKGQVVFVEQPEIHLHPKAQYALVGIIVDAMQRGVKVWLETHSSAILRGFQTKVAEGYIDPKKIALNWFSRDSATGGTSVEIAQPNDKGQYGNWPVDFDETNLSIERAYLDAVAKKLF